MSDNDFGFSFADSEDSIPVPVVSEDRLQQLQEKIDSVLLTNEGLYKSKLKEVEGLILPLLYNLMKNPDMPYIKWENRVPIIQAQINKITAITRDV